MAWLAIDMDGSEYIYDSEPYTNCDGIWCTYDPCFKLPKGTIEKIIGRVLTWEDKPVELE